MAIILNLETATTNCSVSLGKDGELIAIIETNDEGYSHAENLHRFILEVVKEAGLTLSDLDAISVSKGPGSYTGLRIGVSAAKGLCFSLGIPLLAIDTLEILAAQMQISDGMIIPMLDARRMEVYTAGFGPDHKRVANTTAEIITGESFTEPLATTKLYFIGDGAKKCVSVIEHENAIFPEVFTLPSSREMIPLSESLYQSDSFEDVAYFEPYYLKDFVTTKPKS
ncbi:tRNA (adenosine(37)-N6)-threonylcarbamoyltransferase complex dimerization subunit type 1 TsaB [Robertkochia solimangrovi]|uniref:tRNA (adenosine(37)-N6)-threonylcarbamoyltransferase complex dimerization subunit type 1 TsaB n=1 Tax=Robertkochia solimangrovi TaxID=2213046 RepID=UPI00117CAE30|nr:tRNA (adenosine(37)-N6)-threonylcarbamoyltransferase complex dimerization subunit type 1 TsaB [Robertkochia solimangrovi]TRZ45767.1 tRNA (adenosine(37)-N6)-threonylcarbamoyltransferase complex dimerization subunit type 1 TsaB [Robertkochia solimangrovi]